MEWYHDLVLLALTAGTAAAPLAYRLGRRSGLREAAAPQEFYDWQTSGL